MYLFAYQDVLDNLEFPFLYCNSIESYSRCIGRTEVAPDITLRDLPQVSIKSIQLHNQIGTGGFGKVYLGTLLPDNIHVAIKELTSIQSSNHINQTLFREFQKEVYIQSLLDHPNIVKLYGVISSPPRMVLQLIDGLLSSFYPFPPSSPPSSLLCLTPLPFSFMYLLFFPFLYILLSLSLILCLCVPGIYIYIYTLYHSLFFTPLPLLLSLYFLYFAKALSIFQGPLIPFPHTLSIFYTPIPNIQ